MALSLVRTRASLSRPVATVVVRCAGTKVPESIKNLISEDEKTMKNFYKNYFNQAAATLKNKKKQYIVPPRVQMKIMATARSRVRDISEATGIQADLDISKLSVKSKYAIPDVDKK
mmetsp:Transcript_27694/g.65673  ORF Transcript_27694/g.65673 Transcript_27694/m.65673 type:complete len:116 (+) Transcript_27694:11-358(+)